MTELITNGTFDADVSWSLGGSVNISSGRANMDGAGQFVYQPITYEIGEDYRCTLNYFMTVGSKIRINVQSTNGAAVVGVSAALTLSTTGFLTFDFTAPVGATHISIEADSAFYQGWIDNVSLQKIVANPIITSRDFRTVYDGKRLSHPLHADRPVTWSIVSGADQADFEIVGNLLRWVGNAASDYDAPADSDTNNIYAVTVRATDSLAATTDQPNTITVAKNAAGVAVDTYAEQDNEGTPTFFDNSLAADFVWADFFDTDDSVHVLTATALATGTPSLGAPSLSGLHNLAASALATGTPSLGNPAVSQKQSLAANSLDAGTPTLGAPAFTIVQTFVATGLSAGTPTLGTPAQTQGHLLTATALATGTPALGAPSITQRNNLVATALAAGTPTLGAPAVTGKHSLSANGLAAGTPTLGTPGLSLKNIFTAVGLSTPAPVLGLPLLLIAGVMTPVSLAAGVPVLGSPSATQRHGLAPAYLTAGTPALGAPIVTQVNRLTVTSLATGSPVLGEPAVQQQHKIIAAELAAGTPALDSVTLVLAYQLQADDLVWYAPTLGAPDLNYIPPVIPADRMITLAPVSTMLTPDAPYVIVTPPRQPCTIILAGYEEVFMSSEYFNWPDKLAPAVIFYGVDWARRLGEATIVSHNFELVGGGVTLAPRTPDGTQTSVSIAGGAAGSVAVIIASVVASDGETHAIRVSIDIA